MTIRQFSHTVGASLPYSVVWEAATTDPITAETWTVTGPDSTLVATPLASTGAERLVRLAGGTAAARYRVRHAVTFASGYSDARTFEIAVVDR